MPIHISIKNMVLKKIIFYNVLVRYKIFKIIILNYNESFIYDIFIIFIA